MPMQYLPILGSAQHQVYPIYHFLKKDVCNIDNKYIEKYHIENDHIGKRNSGTQNML